MKKKLFFTCLIGLMSMTSAYAKCVGGTEITNSVGTTFCKSNVAMNWWTAYAWCRANDLHLATMYEMCPSWDGNVGSGKCSELSGSGNGYAMSATANGSNDVFNVSLSDGRTSFFGRERYEAYASGYGFIYAFCR